MEKTLFGTTRNIGDRLITWFRGSVVKDLLLSIYITVLGVVCLS